MECLRRTWVVIAFVGVSCPRAGRASDVAPGPVSAEARPANDERPEGAPAHHDSGRAARTVAWVSLSLGAEASVVAVVTSFMLLHQKGVRDSECDASKICSQRGLDANAAIGSLAPWNVGSWIVAAAGLGAGAILLFTHRSDTRERTVIAVSPGPAGVGVGLWRTF